MGHSEAEGIGLMGELRGPRPQSEQVAQEVLVSGVLLQPTEQVGHSHVEVTPSDDRRVQQQPAHLISHRPGLGGRHALEHLELHPIGDAPALGQ